MTKYPQVLINVPLISLDHLRHRIVQEAVSLVEAKLADCGRVVLRPSGTEPVVRVMVEGEHPEVVYDCAQQIAASVEKVASFA